MTRLLHPEALLPLAAGLAALAALVLLAALAAGARRRRLLGAGPPVPGLSRDVRLLLALGAVALALVGPRIGTREERITASGVDLVVLLDVSASMEARDVPPSRGDRARRNAAGVIAGLEPQDRVALAAFAGHGVLLTPLTPDGAALLDVLPSLDGSLLRARGSDLGDGLRAALAGFDAASARPRVLLLLSDGEDAAQRAVDGSAAAAAGVRILAVAIGGSGGAAIPDGDRMLRDGAGAVIRTRADSGRLAALAEATGGALLPADAFGGLDLAAALAAIRRDAAASGGAPTLRVVPAIRVAPFAGAAFALLLLDAAFPLGLPRLRRRRRRAAAFAATLLCVGIAGPGRTEPSEAEAAVEALEGLAAARPGDAAVWVRLGVARMRAGRGRDAERTFLAAALTAKEPRLAALAFYDLGVAALTAGDLERARDAFFDALALYPGDAEARFNLEWTLRALRERLPPPTSGEGAGAGRDDPGAGEGDDEGRPEATSSAAGAGEPGAEGAGAGGDGAEPGKPGHAEAEGARAPVLGEEETNRWLDAVRDDPGRALREAARREAAGRPPQRGPAW